MSEKGWKIFQRINRAGNTHGIPIGGTDKENMGFRSDVIMIEVQKG